MKRILKAMVVLLLAGIMPIELERPAKAQGAAEAAKAAAANQLTGIALARGQVNVIVGLPLATGFVAERGRSIAQIANQRSAIAAAHAALQADLAGSGATEYASWETLPYVALKVNAASLQRLAASPLVASIQEDRLSSPDLASSTALIGADVTAASGFTGDNWAVVILDTGIDANHPFFSGRVVWQACFSNGGGGGATLCPGGGTTQSGPGAAEVTMANGNPIANCDDGAGNQICDHGVHVAGIAAGEDPPTNPQGFNGVAPGAFIIPIQVFTRFTAAATCSPNPAPCVQSYDSDQISALNYVNTTLVPLWDIAAVNMSLGGGQNNVACDGDAKKAPIDALLANGVATVIAAGNNGWTDTIGAPGCISTAVTVGAVTDNDAVIFNMGNLVDILGPGQGIISSVPNDAFGSKSGTSMATPHVTGAFAVIRSIVGPSWSVADILTLLQNTGPMITDTRAANNPGGAGSGTLTGYVKPRLQLDAAVADLLPADVRVLKDCKPDNPAVAGDTAACTIFVDNLGPAPAINVTLVDEHLSVATFTIGTVQISPANAGTCTKTARTVTCDLGNIAANEGVTVTVPITTSTPQDVNDIATVSSDNDDPDESNNVASDHLTFVGSSNLSITKTDSPDPVVAGTTLTYMISVGNAGPSIAADVVVKDTLPAQFAVLNVVVGGGAGSCTNGIPGNPLQPLTCTLGNLAVGAAGNRTITVTGKVHEATPEGTVLNNNATVASAYDDPVTSNNSFSATTTVQARADMTITKTSDKPQYKPSSIVTYTVKVTNTGASNALAVVVRDTLPDMKQAIYQSDTGGCTKSANTLTCNMGNMAVGESKSFNIYLLVKGNRGTIDNTVSVSSSTTDPNPNNNTATLSVLVK